MKLELDLTEEQVTDIISYINECTLYWWQGYRQKRTEDMLAKLKQVRDWMRTLTT